MPTHGHVVWNELNTHDAETAKRFFATTIGWSFDPMPMPGGQTYWLIKQGDAMVGGIFTLDDPSFAGVPEHWLTYLEVDNVDHRVEGIAAAGGSVVRPPWTIEGVGRVAVIRLPGGGVMTWMTSAPRPA